ncbi:MAG: stage II sporulation protein M [Methanobacterium sp.]|uniref:stage II sporulation protein M n=1 Tax=Methanobacterium sp. TaxID=2164 RepID=UPI003C73297C
MSKTSTDNDFLHRSHNYFVGLYHRNVKFIIFSTAIFFIAVIIGGLLGYFLPRSVENFLMTIVKSDQLLAREHGITTYTILTHNLQSLFITFLGGVVGVVTFITIFLNGFIYGSFLGYLGSSHVTSTTLGPLSPTLFIIYTVPHGIFEISGFIIAGAGGFRLTKIIYNLLKSQDSVSDHYWEFKDAMALFIIAIVLIVIAAIIEANYTLLLGNYITHLH